MHRPHHVRSDDLMAVATRAPAEGAPSPDTLFGSPLYSGAWILLFLAAAVLMVHYAEIDRRAGRRFGVERVWQLGSAVACMAIAVISLVAELKR